MIATYTTPSRFKERRLHDIPTYTKLQMSYGLIKLPTRRVIIGSGQGDQGGRSNANFPLVRRDSNSHLMLEPPVANHRPHPFSLGLTWSITGLSSTRDHRDGL